jgi:hypothetical protein
MAGIGNLQGLTDPMRPARNAAAAGGSGDERAASPQRQKPIQRPKTNVALIVPRIAPDAGIPEGKKAEAA